MKLFRILYLAAGAVLFAVLIAAFDFEAALARVWDAGWGALGLILLIGLTAFVMDTIGWQLAMPSVPLTPLWLWRCWRVRMVGEAFNMVLPAGGLGGEPVKAAMMRRRHAIPLEEGLASIITTRTIMTIGQFALVLLCLPFLLGNPALDPAYRITILIAAAVMFLMTLALCFLPRMRLSALMGRLFAGRRWAAGLAARLHHVENVEGRVWGFYRAHPRRFLSALAIETFRWSYGALEVYVALWFLGAPVGLFEAVLIETVIQLIRTISFFIPSNLGTQDGAYTLMVGALTGMPAMGLGAALLRRIRELLFIALGFAIGARAALETKGGDDPPATAPQDRPNTS